MTLNIASSGTGRNERESCASYQGTAAGLCLVVHFPRSSGKLLLGHAKDAIELKLSRTAASEEWAYAGEGRIL
jgi:hypothetical protein